MRQHRTDNVEHTAVRVLRRQAAHVYAIRLVQGRTFKVANLGMVRAGSCGPPCREEPPPLSISEMHYNWMMRQVYEIR